MLYLRRRTSRICWMRKKKIKPSLFFSVKKQIFFDAYIIKHIEIFISYLEHINPTFDSHRKRKPELDAPRWRPGPSIVSAPPRFFVPISALSGRQKAALRFLEKTIYIRWSPAFLGKRMASCGVGTRTRLISCLFLDLFHIIGTGALL
jgi:hypothetical protein